MEKIEPTMGRQARTGRCAAALVAAGFLVFAAAGAQAQYYDYGTSKGVTVNQSVLDSLGPLPTGQQPQTPNNPWVNPATPGVPQAPIVGKGNSIVDLKRPSGKPRKAVAKKPPAGESAVAQQASEPATAGETKSAAAPATGETPATPAPKATAKSGGAVKANPPPPEVKAASSGAPQAAPVPALPSPSAPSAAPGSITPPSSAAAPTAPAMPAVPAAPAPQKQASTSAPPPAPSAGAPTPVTPAPAPAAPSPTASAPAVAPAPGPAMPAAPAPQTAAARAPPVPLGDGTRIPFAGEETDLNDAGKQALAGIVQKLQAQSDLRVQLLAYASGPADQASKARRTSLSRALAVRTYLLAQGIQSTRIDVRALGNTTDEQPVDRVDAIPVKS